MFISFLRLFQAVYTNEVLENIGVIEDGNFDIFSRIKENLPAPKILRSMDSTTEFLNFISALENSNCGSLGYSFFKRTGSKVVS